MTDPTYLDLHGRTRIGELELAVDVSVPRGSTVAVLGPNGAGKTTLLRVVAGLIPLESGTLRIGGETVDDPASRHWTPPEARSVGFVFQDRMLFPHLSVGDNVAFGLRARGVRKREADAHAREWLAAVDLDDRFDVRPAELSGGQAQRVALARALATRPAVLLLDEPSTALDTDAQTRLRDLLTGRLADHDGVRILVTHDRDEAAAVADTIIALEAGRVVDTTV